MVLLWVKRLTLIILVPVIVFGYSFYERISTKRQNQQTVEHALVTAHVWIAAAKFRSEPERFLAYRDSLLRAHSLSAERIQDYMNRNKNRPEEYDLFTRLVNHYVDSLSVIEMELLRGDTAVKDDSVEK